MIAARALPALRSVSASIAMRSATALIALCLSARLAGAQDAAGRILVMPFENLNRDSRIFWLGEAAAVLLTDDLTSLGAKPITRGERHRAFERLQVPSVAALTDATVIRIGQLVGADRVIVGTLQLERETLVVRARSIALDTGRVQADANERGALQDLYAIFTRVARALSPESRAAPAIPRERPPIAAFESYIKGLLAETPATAINYLSAALKLQPAFDLARLALWDVYTDQGDSNRALSAVTSIEPGSPYLRRATFLAGLSQLDLKRYEDAFLSFKTLADAGRVDAAALNNLGVVQLRRGATPQSGLPTYYFNKAAEADPDDSDFIFNLGYAYWVDRDTQAAIYWLREAVRRRPTDGVAHYVLGTTLASAGSSAEASREKELARRLSSEYAQWDKRPASDPIPKGLERVKREVELPHARSLDKLSTSEKRDQDELARFYLDSGRRQFERENDREAAAELNRALYLSPYLADAHLLLGRIHLRNGRVKDAIDAFKIALWSAETAEAHAALGEAYRQDKDPTAARAEAERALALDPASADAKALLARLEGR